MEKLSEEYLWQIPGFDGYYITKDGRVWSDRKHRWIGVTVEHHRYPRVTLYIGPKAIGYSIHRLMAATFLGLDLSDSKTEVDHIDRNKYNNTLSNLRLVTRTENELAKVGRFGIDNETHKLCSKCKKFLLRIMFNINNASSDGLYHTCRICRSNER